MSGQLAAGAYTWKYLKPADKARDRLEPASSPLSKKASQKNSKILVKQTPLVKLDARASPCSQRLDAPCDMQANGQLGQGAIAPKGAPHILDLATYATFSPALLMTAHINGQVIPWDRRLAQVFSCDPRMLVLLVIVVMFRLVCFSFSVLLR
ncbi:hypothetical protein L226DRAFT_524911 [Lentinus tigrinus ALCF2SS1-7]|uniref:Uncharacterized protein n=1 Tax=Lentinus tigrinus ALCF2SS1-6 TaxID=1328759 RepID=A0A5C2S1P5_9APHY|nr:hypothetical protein L227DRAFT_565412 [Lentinus tigrinus ALCF2SS1-6]RPD72037.1 hypothetical protein L226DRAFT_524911 [Lentinus tigrinus ALCF2SS1-7]